MRRRRSFVALLTLLAVLSGTLFGPVSAGSFFVGQARSQTAGVDLLVESFAYSGGNIVPGDPIGDDVALTIRNAGSVSTGSFFVGFYISPDPTITVNDTLLTGGREYVEELLAGSTLAVPLASNAAVPETFPNGPAYLGVVVDDQFAVDETDRTNNTAYQAVTVGAGMPTRTETFDFFIHEPNAVPFQLFEVLTPGTIEATITWTGDTPELTATLTGRRRPGLTDPTEPYAQATGASPLTLSYTVTEADVARGVGWRLALTDTSGQHDAQGTIELTTPYDAVAQGQFEAEKISLRSGSIWPSANLQADFLTDLGTTSTAGLHGLISLTATPLCVNTGTLERQGFVRQSFLSNRNSFGLILKGADPSDPLIAPLIRAVTPLEPEDKIDPHILLGDYAHYHATDYPQGTTGVSYVLNGDGTLNLSVLFARDVSRSVMTRILAAEAASYAAISDRHYRADVAPANLIRLAENDEIEWIEAGPAPLMLDLDITRGPLEDINGNGVLDPGEDTNGDGNLDTGINADQVQNVTNINAGTPAITYGGPTGNNIVVGIQDQGVDGTHPDINLVGTLNSFAVGSHGTHVAGIVSGSGVQSNQNNANGNPNGGTAFQWRGVAPQASVLGAGDLDSAGDLFTAITTQSLDIVNRSQSVSYDGSYDAENQDVDAHIRGGSTSNGTPVPRRPHTYSAGNHGGTPGNQRPSGPGGLPAGTNQTFNNGQIGFFSLTKQMKNVIIVGNWDANRSNLSPGSSLGPAHDGRIKPDVVAPGSNVVSTGTNGDGSCVGNGTNLSNGYTGCSGTSMASPAVAGTIALMLEAWQDTYSTPLGVTIDDAAPLPATMRAVLIQTAVDVANNNIRNATSADIDSDSDPTNGSDGSGNVTATAGPDYATGWGLIDAQAAVGLIQDARTENGNPVPNRIVQDASTQGEVDEFGFVVDAGGPIKVTLAWDDVESSPANLATNTMLINDLDLVLEAPDGTIYYPWQLGHTIVDGSGTPIPPQNQTPGTPITIQRAITPITNPQFTWQVQNCPAGSGCTTRWAPVGPGNVDYVPACALNGTADATCPAGADDAWVATTGRDHLNNVEQVFVNVPAGDPGKIGHWTARVTGFDIRAGSQDYALVGLPYPDRPDLVAFSDDKAGIPGFGTSFDVTWTAGNVGQLATDSGGAPGTFDYRIWLSDDVFLDSGDVNLIDTNTDGSLPALGPLGIGASTDQTNSISISQANADALLGTSGVTFADFMDTDPFVLVELDSEDAILEHRETNVAPLQAARIVDVVLVMDRSGSMSGVIPVSSGSQTKLAALSQSAKLFLDLLRQGAGDRLGEVSFNDSATKDFQDGSGNVANFWSGTIGAAQSAIDSLSSGGQTDIRDGLDTGFSMIPTGTDRRRVIIFFSDGEKTDGGDPTEAGFLQQFSDNDIRLYSVGFGTKGAEGYAGLDVDLLETLASTGDNGFYHVTQEPTGLDKFFVNAVAGAIDSEVVIDPVADIAAGDTQRVDVDLSNQASVASFVLTWDNPSADLSLTLIGPQGTRITPGNASGFGDRVERTTGASYEIVTVHLPLTGGANQEHGGTWVMEITNPSGPTVEYSASALAKSTVRATSEQPPQPDSDGFNPGDSVDFNMELSQQGGNPIGNATITVTPVVPVVGIGDLLAGGAVTSTDLAGVPNTINGEELSLRERMIIALQNKLGSNPLPRREGTPFTLSGDRTGAYAGSYTSTGTPGPYSFTLHAEAVADDCSPVSREAISTIGVNPGVDPGRTPVIVTTPGDGSHTVVVTPRGSAGNYVGPGYADQVEVIPTTSGLVPVGSVQDNLDGSYSQRLEVAGQVGVVLIEVAFRGIPLTPVTVDTGAPTPGTVIPGGGTSGGSGTVVIGVPGGGLALVSGVNLVLGDLSVPLTITGLDDSANTITATVPAGMTPGKYSVQFETRQGESQSALSALTSYRVLGEGQALPGGVEDLKQGFDELLGAKDQDEINARARELLAALRALEPDQFLTAADIAKAATQVAEILAGQSGPVARDALRDLDDALDRSMIDARYLPTGPVTTPAGKDIGLDLGNDVLINFGEVGQPGTSQVTVSPGPSEFGTGVRGRPHLRYDVTTSAGFDPAQGIGVTINYREGDFGDESQLRIFHWENGAWVDRTGNLDTQGNAITANVEGLSPFVLATGAPTGRPPTLYLPLVVRGNPGAR